MEDSFKTIANLTWNVFLGARKNPNDVVWVQGFVHKLLDFPLLVPACIQRVVSSVQERISLSGPRSKGSIVANNDDKVFLEMTRYPLL